MHYVNDVWFRWEKGGVSLQVKMVDPPPDFVPISNEVRKLKFYITNRTRHWPKPLYITPDTGGELSTIIPSEYATVCSPE